MHYPCAINRIDDHIVIEDVNIKRRKNLNLDDEERQKMGEIMLKDNKYYFIPNKKENMNINDLTGEDLFAWLIFKGTKYPINKYTGINKYNYPVLKTHQLIAKHIEDERKRKIEEERKEREKQRYTLVKILN